MIRGMHAPARLQCRRIEFGPVEVLINVDINILSNSLVFFSSNFQLSNLQPESI
jgi:hypothetical protein